MLTICAKCTTPQECGVVKGRCMLWIAEAQSAASGGGKTNYQAQMEACNAAYGRGVRYGSAECGAQPSGADISEMGL